MNSILKKLPHWSSHSGLLITLLICLLVITPVILNQLVPLNDYPFHLARIIILSNLDNPVYSEFYKQGSFLLPNMAMDMIAIPLTYCVSAETASRIFVMLSLLSMLFGTMLLHRAAHNRFSPWPLLAVILLFNGIFRFGFLNYIFGIGVAFCAASLWLIQKPGYKRLFVSLIMSIFLVLLHFSAFGIYAIIIGSVEIYTAYIRLQKDSLKSSVSQLFISSIPFFITIALFIYFSPTAEEVSTTGFNYPNYLGAKPFGALYSVLTGITWLDILSLSSLAITTAFLVITKKIKIFPPLLFSLLMLMLAFIVLPSSFMGSSFVYVRLGPAIALLWLTTIDIKAEQVSINRLIAYLALILAIFTSVAITNQWERFNKQTSEIISTFDRTEQGATIFNATTQPFTRLIADTEDRRFAWNPPLKHIASYAVLYGPKFVPMTFADLTKQPLNVNDKYQVIKNFQGDNPRKTFTAQELEIYLLEIRNHLKNGDWPALDNVYVFVMGFDRIKNSFNISKLNGWAHVVELNDDHILIKLKS